ncbi:hypothetical protein BJX70DRAFT_141000 [Aspergillus crustosus]
MPQCIAQQDQSTWLSALTTCTAKRCTSHFGIICTHHQWLTQLSCLSVAFSPDVIEHYLPYCGRSVLAKAQLHLWTRTITGRAWLVDVGDANGLERLSPASLAEGYAAVDVIYKAPSCLTDSASSRSIEPFQHVMASCSFTGTSQHTGNAARPWEYSESQRSVISLDSETAGYDLIQRRIRNGNYFDITCFCSAFTIDPEEEPCSESGQLDITKERLWTNATCGSTSLPDSWADGLKIIGPAYIPIEDWHWPIRIADIPKPLSTALDQCATDACESGLSGYCEVKRAVDRACFCHEVSYDFCKGSCQNFESRIDYIKWLHHTCSRVQDWHGLPENWRRLATPAPLEMIPWRWTIKPSNESDHASFTQLRYPGATEACASNEWKLASFALVNTATCFAAMLSQRIGTHRIARGSSSRSHPASWILKGTLIAAMQILANWLNSLFVQQTPGYENVPVIQLILIWCSIPRLAWLSTLLFGIQPSGVKQLSAAASSLFAEVILQSLSSYYIVMTVNYGREHNFYLGGTEGAERGGQADIMYAGALVWLIIIGVVLVQLTKISRGMDRQTGPGSLDPPKWSEGNQTTSSTANDLVAHLGSRDAVAHHIVDKCRDSEETPLTSSERGNHTAYGTFPVEGQHHWALQKAFVEHEGYTVTVIGMLLLWIAQWLFWGGFVGLSSDEFCLPRLGVLTAVWITFSMAGTMIIHL